MIIGNAQDVAEV